MRHVYYSIDSKKEEAKGASSLGPYPHPKKDNTEGAGDCNLSCGKPHHWGAKSRWQLSRFIFCSSILRGVVQKAPHFIRIWEVMRNYLMTAFRGRQEDKWEVASILSCSCRITECFGLHMLQSQPQPAWMCACLPGSHGRAAPLQQLPHPQFSPGLIFTPDCYPWPQTFLSQLMVATQLGWEDHTLNQVFSTWMGCNVRLFWKTSLGFLSHFQSLDAVSFSNLQIASFELFNSFYFLLANKPVLP